MFMAFAFCILAKSTTVPSGSDWLRRPERDGNRVRLITRGGYNWTDPRIVEAARENRVKQVVINGEAIMLGIDASLNRKRPRGDERVMEVM
jgi:hypothetical protein